MSKSKYLHGYTSEEQARLEDSRKAPSWTYVYEGGFKRHKLCLRSDVAWCPQSKILLKIFFD
ncbi:MAG: hypothetical protein IPJ71_19810 [Bdellovibrionales bacterium]|nr:hypothetical protein [Bdellovibrionales bacterium]